MKKDRKEVALERTRKTNALVKITLSTIGLCVAMLILIILQCNAMPWIIETIEAEGEMKETVWVVEHFAYLPPAIITVVTLYFVFYSKKSYVPAVTQRQKALVVAILMVFMYGVLFLGIVAGRTLASTFDVFARDLSDFVDMFEMLTPWFLIQLVPFSIILAYHLIRASSEKKELLENEE